jgi:alpha-glycerophosphate oxidase/glycerol-3-phosphate dehydrogenase
VSLRSSNLEHLQQDTFDVLIIGGGINGAVSAASLAARGARVALIDRHDFAAHTSSSSSNLVWGGIKYLESLEFPLVSKLCGARNHLMRSYPSTVKEIRFFTTIARGFRFWSFFVYLGALLYWFMGRCFTRPPAYRTAAGLESGEPVINTSNAAGGLEYSDAYLYDNDARFVFSFVRRALDHGCIAANYVAAESNEFRDGLWHTQARDTNSGQAFTIRARTLVNAAGPQVDELNTAAGIATRHHHVFSKGIHLIVDKITDNRRVLAFFASDGRLFFLIPMGHRTCIGTTDTEVKSPEVSVTDEDRDFVIANANALLDLDRPLTRDDIIAERCGVRPLAVANGDGGADWVQLSRKHVIETDRERRQLSIFGGKLTDCLNVGEEIAGLVREMGIELHWFDHRWYGEPEPRVREEFMHQARLMDLDASTDPSSPEPLSERFWRRYGDYAFELLEQIREDPRRAELLIENAEYTRCEIELAARREMIVKLEDFIRRRSKIELVVRREEFIDAPGLKEACRILFGEEAEMRLAEYRDG